MNNMRLCSFPSEMRKVPFFSNSSSSLFEFIYLHAKSNHREKITTRQQQGDGRKIIFLWRWWWSLCCHGVRRVERSFNLIMWSKILDLLKRASVQVVLIPIMLFDFFLNVTTCPPPMIERLPGVNQNKIFLESSLVLQSVLVVKNKESFNVLSLKRHSSRVKYSDTRLNVNCEIDLGWKGLVSVKDTLR